jgi:hypothetical protein
MDLMIYCQELTMDWTVPAFVEIKMDAEIGSYQEDREEREPAPFYVEGAAEEAKGNVS